MDHLIGDTMTVNKAILIGNLCADPELRTTNSGTSVAKLRLATNERRKDRDGNWSDHTEFHSLVVWGKTAENAAKFLSKGSQAYFEGRIQTRKWQDKDGRDRWSTEIVVFNMRFIGGKGQGQSNGNSGGYSSSSSGGYSNGGNSGGYDNNAQDIPF